MGNVDHTFGIISCSYVIPIIWVNWVNILVGYCIWIGFVAYEVEKGRQS